MDKREFKSLLALAGYTQHRLALEMDMADSTMIRKVKNNSFTIPEAELMGKLLNVPNLGELFFPHKDT